MTNVSATPEKVGIRKWLFELAIEALEVDGWKVEKIPGSGKSSIRKITKDGTERVATIRTSQDTWIAFPRTDDDSGWATLEDADVVIASSVNEKEDPKFGQVHIIEADDMRARFDRLYKARREAGHALPIGRGVWISLYGQEVPDPVYYVGAGAGLANPPLLKRELLGVESEKSEHIAAEIEPKVSESDAGSLTIAEAKRRLAATFGVREDDISITING
jgi:hypothetical protein